MKLQIDTVAKTIKIEQSEKITDILSLVKKLLPNDWKEYSLEAVSYIYNWSNPILLPFTYTGAALEQNLGVVTTSSSFCIEAN